MFFCHAIQFNNLENGFTKDPMPSLYPYWFDLWASISIIMFKWTLDQIHCVKDELFVQSNLECLSCIEESLR